MVLSFETEEALRDGSGRRVRLATVGSRRPAVLRCCGRLVALALDALARAVAQLVLSGQDLVGS